MLLLHNMDIRENEITRVTLWGAAANVILAGLKLCAGIFGHSAAMVADAVHSMSDLVSDIIVLALVKVSSRGRDKGHNYGHGKFETLGTAVVALLLFVVGAELIANGISKISIVLKGGTIEVPGGIALIAALVSIAVKELLFQVTAHTGKKHDSPVVVTNAWHHRTDALSSVGAALGIGTAILFGGRWAILDPIVCCAISIFIFYIAVKMAIPAINELTEASLSDEVESEIRDIIQSVHGIDDVHALKTRQLGRGIIVDSHIVVNPQLTVREAHDITEVAENRLRERFGPETQISLHVEPSTESR